jgi:hypothetical protein
MLKTDTEPRVLIRRIGSESVTGPYFLLGGFLAGPMLRLRVRHGTK